MQGPNRTTLGGGAKIFSGRQKYLEAGQKYFQAGKNIWRRGKNIFRPAKIFGGGQRCPVWSLHSSLRKKCRIIGITQHFLLDFE
jgi:hypothetical protein